VNTKLIGIYTTENCNLIRLCAKDLGSITTINLNEVLIEGNIKNYSQFYAASFFSTSDRYSNSEGKMLLNYGVIIFDYPTKYITVCTKLNFHPVMRSLLEGSRHLNMINTQDFLMPEKKSVFVSLYSLCLKLLLKE
jgi:hypothetical protein